MKGTDVDNFIGLDFETYGSVNLPERGLDNYVNDEFFQPLIAALYKQDEMGHEIRAELDFVNHYEDSRRLLIEAIEDTYIVAHNAGFEKAVLASMGIDVHSEMFIDSAVIARAAGAAGKLEAAAPQLLGIDKFEMGFDLIKLFSIPGLYQEANGHPAFDPQIILDNSEKWRLFIRYCNLDAKLSYDIAKLWAHTQPPNERQFNALTMDMNVEGWAVDKDLLERMQRQYECNLEEALQSFQEKWDPKAELNFNSLAQMKKWCADRGVRASSFNEASVAKMLKAIGNKLDKLDPQHEKHLPYLQVFEMLMTKQILGGSSLKKLDVIARTVGPDGRLRDQYLHCGAGQTWRTSGRSVQMQNLKRLGPEPDDVSDVTGWSNDKLAANLRQVFTAGDPGGRLIVGDFSSVESRGLAYLADEDWKTEAFTQGKDLYKVLAGKIFDVTYDDVTKSQRQTGKVGELSCGYGAGPGAVVSFAEGMGVSLSEMDATELVRDWRDANPQITNLWQVLDKMLHDVLAGITQYRQRLVAGGSLILTIETCKTPESLAKQHSAAQSIRMSLVWKGGGGTLLERYFHGCYLRGRSVCYYKPSELKGGDLWKPTFVNPKTKQEQFYSIYGGKLTGILTQSFCRQIFFMIMQQVKDYVDRGDNLRLIGQFHDELVLEWTPNKPGLGIRESEHMLTRLMSDAGPFEGFPLNAEVKSDYRYIK